MHTANLLNTAARAGLNSLHDLRLLFLLAKDPDKGMYFSELRDKLPAPCIHGILHRLTALGLIKHHHKPLPRTGKGSALRAYYQLTAKGRRWTV